eukprot:9057849-Pyramimonas_sp.AAC.1
MPGSFVGERRPLVAAGKATRVSFALRGGGLSFSLPPPRSTVEFCCVILVPLQECSCAASFGCAILA